VQRRAKFWIMCGGEGVLGWPINVEAISELIKGGGAVIGRVRWWWKWSW